MGAREGLRRRHDHRKARTHGRVFKRLSPACVPNSLHNSPLLFVSRQKETFGADAITPHPHYFVCVADLRPDEVAAIDKAGTQGPPGSARRF
jgi:hypothetical protein